MPKLSPGTNHIGLPCHWFRNRVSSLEIDFQVLSSADQLADQFAKRLWQKKFESLRKVIMGWWIQENMKYFLYLYLIIWFSI